MKSSEVRSRLVDALRLDLIGPQTGSELAGEVLSQSPSRWYLTGFLVPLDAGEAQRLDETADDELDAANDSEGADDATAPDLPPSRRAFYPSSMGMSLLVPRETKTLTVHVRWGDYEPEFHGKSVLKPGDLATEPDGEPGPETTSEGTILEVPSGRFPTSWKRVQHEVTVPLAVPAKTTSPTERAVPGSAGLYLALSVRPVASMGSAEGMVPPGTRSVSVFLVNRRPPAGDEIRDQAFVFQAGVEVESDEPLVPRPNVRGLGTDDWDERVADLQYRDVFEFAVGHGISTRATVDPDGHCRTVRT